MCSTVNLSYAARLPATRITLGWLMAALCVAGCNAGHAVGAKHIAAEDADSAAQTTGVTASGGSLDPNTGGAATGEKLPGAGFAAAQDGNAIVVYWGQNESGQEPDLGTMCQQSQYSTIILSFVYVFGSANSQDANTYPSLNFGDHCTTPISTAHPTVLSCPDIAAAIPVCQANGKKILLSMGGAVGTYGFVSDADGQQTADLIWGMFLGGSDALRPFGTAVLDGIDLDIEQGTPRGYAAFATTLKAHMRADVRKPYYLTAAPQCPYPDAYMGPGQGTPLGDAVTAFDFVYVQFYNNSSCQTSSPQGWPTALGAWTSLNANGGPKIFMGLPAAAEAAKEGYLDPTNASAVVTSLKSNKAVGGIMLWDGAYDMPSPGPYSLTMQNLLKGRSP